jgi:Condensation domain
MIRHRLFGTQLEFLLAELMSPTGEVNYNISRYIVFEGELDLEALIAAVERAFSEASIAHCDYEVDSDGAWQVSSARGPCKVEIEDLRDARDPMMRCLEMIRDDTDRIVPVLAKEAKLKAMVFLLGEHAGRTRRVYYHRFHHIQVDGYTAQLLVRRLAELYNAYSGGSELRQADFLAYPALLEEEEIYVRSGQCSADQAFWSEYLADYLKRTEDHLVKAHEVSAEPILQSIDIASKSRGTARLPINAITAAIMTTLHEVSGIACQMIGMTFMRRSRARLDRVMSPMVTVLPLWVDVSDGDGHGDVVSRVDDAVRRIKEHQFYGGERAIRDLGYTGRGGLYLCTVNYRVFDKKPIIFDHVDSASHIISSGPVAGITVIVSMQEDGIQLSIESIYSAIYGLGIGAFVELLEDNLVAMLGGDYYKRTEPAVKYGYTDLRFPAGDTHSSGAKTDDGQSERELVGDHLVRAISDDN